MEENESAKSENNESRTNNNKTTDTCELNNLAEDGHNNENIENVISMSLNLHSRVNFFFDV